MSNVNQLLRLAVSGALFWTISISPAAAQRISAELQTSRVTVANDLADATFKVIIHNEESVTLTNVWLVFEDGFDVAVGDVDGESSKSSEAKTKTFDLSSDGGTLHVPFRATLKYSIDGQPAERPITVVLPLDQ